MFTFDNVVMALMVLCVLIDMVGWWAGWKWAARLGIPIRLINEPASATVLAEVQEKNTMLELVGDALDGSRYRRSGRAWLMRPTSTKALADSVFGLEGFFLRAVSGVFEVTETDIVAVAYVRLTTATIALLGVGAAIRQLLVESTEFKPLIGLVLVAVIYGVLLKDHMSKTRALANTARSLLED